MIYFFTFLFTIGFFCREAYRQQSKSRFNREVEKLERHLSLLGKRLDKAASEEEIYLLIDLILDQVKDFREKTENLNHGDSPSILFTPEDGHFAFDILDIGELSLLQDYYLNRPGRLYASPMLNVI